MFKQDQRIFHPQHGAGKLSGIQKLTIGDAERKYYEVELISGERLLIPVENAEELGLVRLADVHTDYLKALEDDPQPLAKNYKTRQANLIEKLNTGDPEQIAEVFRDLMWRKKQQSISLTDGKLLDRAKFFLATIRAARRDIQLESAARDLLNQLNRSLASRVSAAATD